VSAASYQCDQCDLLFLRLLAAGNPALRGANHQRLLAFNVSAQQALAHQLLRRPRLTDAVQHGERGASLDMVAELGTTL
jgi:hypothetical protein